MKTLNINYTGRKGKVGNIHFDEMGKTCVFVGYCEHHGKVVMTLEEARHFANRYNTQNDKLSTKLLKVFIKRRKLA